MKVLDTSPSVKKVKSSLFQRHNSKPQLTRNIESRKQSTQKPLNTKRSHNKKQLSFGDPDQYKQIVNDKSSPYNDNLHIFELPDMESKRSNSVIKLDVSESKKSYEEMKANCMKKRKSVQLKYQQYKLGLVSVPKTPNVEDLRSKSNSKIGKGLYQSKSVLFDPLPSQGKSKHKQLMESRKLHSTFNLKSDTNRTF